MPAIYLARVQLVQELVADLVAELEAPVSRGVLAAGLSLGALLDQHRHGFRVQALEQFHQVVGGHGQLERLALVALGPADVPQEAEVFGELQAQALGLGEVLGALQRYEEVLDAAEVVADQLIEPFALLAVNGRHGAGHGAPPLDRGTEDEPAPRSRTAYVGTVSLASKARPSVPGPRAWRVAGAVHFCVSRGRTQVEESRRARPGQTSL